MAQDCVFTLREDKCPQMMLDIIDMANSSKCFPLPTNIAQVCFNQLHFIQELLLWQVLRDGVLYIWDEKHLELGFVSMWLVLETIVYHDLPHSATPTSRFLHSASDTNFSSHFTSSPHSCVYALFQTVLCALNVLPKPLLFIQISLKRGLHRHLNYPSVFSPSAFFILHVSLVNCKVFGAGDYLYFVYCTALSTLSALNKP